MNTNSTILRFALLFLSFTILGFSIQDLSAQSFSRQVVTGDALVNTNQSLIQNLTDVQLSSTNGSAATQSAMRGGCTLIVTCPDDITVNNDPDDCTAVVNVPDPEGVNEDCSGGVSQVTLTQSTDHFTILSPNSVSCNGDGSHRDNSYIRKYSLDDEGIDTTLTITSVEFAIESASSNSGTQPLTVNLYLWDDADPCEFASFNLVATKDTMVVDQDMNTAFGVPISATIPKGSTVVVEVFTPDGGADTSLFFIGSNAGGQTGVSYIASAACDLGEPTDLADIGFGDMHVILDIKGEIPSDGGPPTVSLQSGMASGSAFPVGTTTNEYLVEDDFGNSEICSVDITVVDAEAPEALCKNITVEVTAPNNVVITADDVDDGSSDNCTNVNLEIDETTFTAADEGANPVILTVTDDAGNTADCNANVEVMVLTSSFEFLQNVDWSVYPNPSNGRFTVEIENQDGKDFQYTMYNVLGEEVYQSIKWNNTNHISEYVDLQLTEGFYLLVLEKEEGWAVKKITIQE